MDFVRVVRDSKLVALRATFAFPINGKKGDRFTVPLIDTPSVQDKLPETPVTLVVTPPGSYSVDVTHDKVTAFGIENIVPVQSNYNLMSIYSARHGFAMARWVDNEVYGMRAALYAVAAQNIFASSDGTIGGNGTRFDLAAFLAAKTVLDNADVPDQRMLLVSYNQHNAMIGQNFFVSRDFVSAQPIVSGSIGSILNTPVIPSTQIKANSTTGFRNGSTGLPEPSPGVAGSRFVPIQDAFTGLPTVFTGNSKPVHTALMANQEWLAALMQWSPSASHSFENLLQTQAVVFRQTYGMKIYRIDHGVLIHTTGDLA